MRSYLQHTFVFCAAVTISLMASARDIFYYSEGTWGTNATRSKQVSLGAPPLGSPRLLWMNSFDYQQWQDGQSPYSTFRWSTGLRAPIDEKSSFLIFHNISYSSTELLPTPTPEATFTSMIATVANNIDTRTSWSYGLLLTDKANAQRVYPIVGYRYQTEDMKWVYSFGFPTIGVTYTGIEQTDIGLVFARESTRFSVTDSTRFGSNIKYVEQSFNSVGLTYKRLLSPHVKFNARYSYLFASRWHLQNASFETQADGIDYSQQSVFILGLSIE